MENPKVYEQRLVAFVDILGWSDACKVESNRLVKATQIIHSAAEEYSVRSKDYVVSDTRLVPNTMYLAVHVGAFSDSIAVSMPASFGYRIFRGVTQVCRDLLRLGFLTRGGITVGDLHHAENVIFGPALVEAVRLEQEAVYPRLLCSPALIDFLSDRPYDEREELIVIDHLGSRIANLFSFGAEFTEKKMDRSFADELWRVSDIEAAINGEVQKFVDAKADKLAEKWRYMRDVLPVMLRRFGQDGDTKV